MPTYTGALARMYELFQPYIIYFLINGYKVT